MMTERYLPMNINYRKKVFENDLRRQHHLAAWTAIDKLISVMEDVRCWDTIVTVVE